MRFATYALALVAVAQPALAGVRSLSEQGGALGALAAPVARDPAAASFLGLQVPDGSFENGPPPASLWTEARNTTTDCTSGIWDWTTAWDLATPDGIRDFWAGGFCNGDTDFVAIENSLAQEIDVPLDDPILVFWYAALRIDADQAASTDVGYLDVDGVEQWSVDVSTAAANTDGGGADLCFVPARVDLSAFAGQTVELEIGMSTDLSNGVGNVRFDAFAFADLVFADGFECDVAFWSDAVIGALAP